MAINKKLIHFKTLSGFQAELDKGNQILDTSIVFVQDANVIWTHGTFYKCENNLVEVTHSQLVNLRNSKSLIPGTKYRITDYVTIVDAENRFSAEHPFDIVVTALSDDTLSEEASAIAHEGISFFDKYNLSAWKLNYSLDNNFAEWGLTTPREGGYLSNWGFLNKKSTTIDADGKEIHLYSANDGGAYWQNKSLYKNETKTITDIGKIFVVQEDGCEDCSLYLCTEDSCDIMNGKYLAELYWQTDDEDGNRLYYLDEDYMEGDAAYPIRITSVTDEYVTEDEMFVKVEVSGLEELFNGFYGGEISATISAYYSGDYSDIYVPFDSEVVEIITTKGINKIFCTTDGSYYSCPSMYIRRYQHDVECGKGVIYRMIDEFNNDFPYDFYNIGLIKNGYDYFVFGNGSSSNYIDSDTNNNLLQIGIYFSKKKLYIPQLSSYCQNTYIYAEGGFSSISLSASWNNNITIAGGSSTESTATIIIGNSNNNTIQCSSTAQINIGSSCVYNILFIGGKNAKFIAGDSLQNNNVNVSTYFEVGNKFSQNIVNVVQLKIHSDYVTRSIFRGHGAIRVEDARGNLKASVLNFADINIRGDFSKGEVLRLVYDGTTGSSIGLAGLVIRGSQFFRGEFAGKERVVTIDPSYTMDSYGPLTIAQNSKGEILQYIEADLIKA